MSPWKSLVGLAAILSLTPPVLSQAHYGPAGACAPNGLPLSSLTVRTRPGEDLSALRYEGGSELAYGTAFLYFEDPGGVRFVRGFCTSDLRGRFADGVILDEHGHFEWPIPDNAWGAVPTLRVVALTPGWPTSHATVSNSVRLPLVNPSGGTPLGGGQVVITEFMKDPKSVGDADGEWIELYNRSGATIDIEGWVLSDHGSDATVLDNGGLGIPIPPGGYVVLGIEADPSLNGDVSVDATYDGFTLSNGDDEIVLSQPNGLVVDQLLYDDGAAWPDTSGRSISLRPDRLESSANDDGANWCHGTTPISGANPDTGTPGAVNDPCP